MYSLLSHNTFGIDARTEHFFEYSSVEELKSFIAEGLLNKPFLHIGAGSNLLFVNDFHGIVLHSRIEGIQLVDETDEEVRVRVGAGVVWDDFVQWCVENGYYGAENLSLIPGEVGASAVQNIGAYGVEVKDLIISVEVIDACGCERVFMVDECMYAYRDSIFKRTENKTFFVTHVCYRLYKRPRYVLDYGTIRQELAKEQELTLHAVRNVIVRIRQSKLPDPNELGNAGSFFMNPVVSHQQFEKLLSEYPQMPYYLMADGRVKIPAAWMIDQCGWKGKSMGPAAVHDKQPLVLVNKGGANGHDVLALSQAVCVSVATKFGIEIHPEVCIIM